MYRLHRHDTNTRARSRAYIGNTSSHFHSGEIKTLPKMYSGVRFSIHTVSGYIGVYRGISGARRAAHENYIRTVDIKEIFTCMRHMACRMEYFEILLMSFVRILHFHEGE